MFTSAFSLGSKRPLELRVDDPARQMALSYRKHSGLRFVLWCNGMCFVSLMGDFFCFFLLFFLRNGGRGGDFSFGLFWWEREEGANSREVLLFFKAVLQLKHFFFLLPQKSKNKKKNCAWKGTKFIFPSLPSDSKEKNCNLFFFCRK